MIRAISVTLLALGAIGFYVAGNATAAMLAALAALAAAFVFSRPILGNLAGVSKLPEGVTPEDIKNYRSEHSGTSVSEAIRACARQQRG